MKIFTIIGGVNGCGKSSLTGSLKAERTDLGIIVDPDKLTAEMGGDEYEGGKLAVDKLERALTDGVSFTQETTCLLYTSLSNKRSNWLFSKGFTK